MRTFTILNQRRVHAAIAVAALLVWLIVVQSIFLFVQRDTGERLGISLSAIMSSELNSSNFDFMTRSLMDLQRLGNVACAELILAEDPPIAIVKIGDVPCFADSAKFDFSGANVETEQVTASGKRYLVKMRTQNPQYFYIGLWMMRLLGACIIGITWLLFVSVRKKHEIEVEAKKSEANLAHRFAAQVAHDIRSPLSVLSIVGATLPTEFAKQAKLLKTASDRINAIATDVLESYRNTGTRANTWDLNEILVQLVEERNFTLPAQISLSLVPSGAQNCKISSISQSDFERIIANCISNSVDAIGRRSGAITISVLTCSETVAVTLADDGDGIPMSVLETLNSGHFDVTTKDSTSTDRGFGLGSSHARRVIQESGGKITYSSSPGHGTSVAITLLR